MTFAGADRHRPHGPAITHEQLQDLVGAEVATGRGAGYVPHPVEASSFWRQPLVRRSPGPPLSRRSSTSGRRPAATGARGRPVRRPAGAGG